MAVRLIRANSDTPNIQNYDDARILRYAVGGKNGVMKDYKNACNYRTDSSLFTILPGEIIIDGWQVEISGQGLDIITETTSSTLYYSVFAVVDLRTSNNQIGNIEALYDTTLYEHNVAKEDLSNNPFGRHYLLLYTFKVSGGIITDVVRMFDYIEYDKTIFENFNTRIDELDKKIDKKGSNSANAVEYAKVAIKATTVSQTAFSESMTLISSGATKLPSKGIYLIKVYYTVNDGWGNLTSYESVGYLSWNSSRTSFLKIFTGKSEKGAIIIEVSKDGIVSFSIIDEVGEVTTINNGYYLRLY